MTSPDPVVPVERPKPLRNLALLVGSAVGLTGAVTGFLVAFGLVDQATADLINRFSALVAGDAYSTFIPTTTPVAGTWAAVLSGVIPLISTGVGVALHAKLGKAKVTPLADPRDAEGRRLVPAAPVITPVGVDPHPGVADHAKPEPVEVPPPFVETPKDNL